MSKLRKEGISQIFVGF